MKYFFIFSLSLMLISCSRLDRKLYKDDASIRDEIKKRYSLGCYSSEGRGKISSYFQNINFRYESILENDVWKFSIQIPMKGEETLFLDFKNKNVSGTLASKIKLSQNERKILAQKLSAIFYLKDSLKFCDKNICQTKDGQVWDWWLLDGLKLQSKNIKFEVNDLDQGVYKRILIGLYKLVDGKDISLEIFARNCEKNI